MGCGECFDSDLRTSVAKDVFFSLLFPSAGVARDSMSVCFGAQMRPDLNRNHTNKPPMTRTKITVAVTTPVISASDICETGLQQGNQVAGAYLYSKRRFYMDATISIRSEWSRSCDAYSGVFPGVEVDMRLEDIASTKIDGEETWSSWLTKSVSVFTRRDGAEGRGDGGTVLARKKRLQRRTMRISIIAR